MSSSVLTAVPWPIKNTHSWVHNSHASYLKKKQYNDLELSQLEFTSKLLTGERAIADKGYADESYFLTPNCLFYNRKLLKNIMARHENAKIKGLNHSSACAKCLDMVGKTNYLLHVRYQIGSDQTTEWRTPPPINYCLDYFVFKLISCLFTSHIFYFCLK